jgi:hypothetical protein
MVAKIDVKCMRGHVLGKIFMYERKGKFLGTMLNFEVQCWKCAKQSKMSLNKDRR